MKKKLIFLLLLGSMSMMWTEAQTCKELFKQANSLRSSGNLSKARQKYNQVKSCGDASYAKDCDYWISWIDAVQKSEKAVAPNFGVSQKVVIIPYQGGQWVVTVDGKSAYDVSVNEDWCTIKKSGRQIIITSTSNESLRNRIANINVTSGNQTQNIEVINEGAPERIWSSVSSLTFPASGDSNTIDIFSNTNWKVSDVPSWLIAKKSGDNIEFIAEENNKSVERSADVKIVSPSDTIIVINIYQNAGNEKLSFSKNHLTFGPDGGDEYIKVYTDAKDWKLGDFPHWCQVSKIGNDSLLIHCTANQPIGEIREASINVTTGNQTLGINVSQEPKPMVATIPILGIGGRAISFGFNAGYIMPMVNASSSGNYTGSLVNYGVGNNSENASYSASGGFSVGAFADIKLTKNLYLIAGVNYMHYAYKNDYKGTAMRTIPYYAAGYALKGEVENSYKEDYTMSLIEVPILASYRFPITRTSHVQVNLGPAIQYGMSAKMKITGTSDTESLRAYTIVNHQITNQYYDNGHYSLHNTGSGEMDLYSDQVKYKTTHTLGNAGTITEDCNVKDAPLKKLNFGLKLGVGYEINGISLGLEYLWMVSNMANSKFWDGDRWPIFNQTTKDVMSGYKQSINYLQVKIGYTFRY